MGGFTDVKPGDYFADPVRWAYDKGMVTGSADYARAVAWAVEKGVTSGTSATTFSPDSVCTRGQIVTFLYRGLTK